jgi:threonine/homoserine efflux transporter RhtA
MDFTVSISLAPLIALIAGIIILVAPRTLNYVVALYLILIGLLGLFPNVLR